MGRNFSIRPSHLLNFTDEVVAFDFDRAASYRLVQYDNQRERDSARINGISAAMAFGGETLEFDDETDIDSIPEAP